nr:hypothetical protein [Candidatus Freyrarchaeum guaymaensis]
MVESLRLHNRWKCCLKGKLLSSCGYLHKSFIIGKIDLEGGSNT